MGFPMATPDDDRPVIGLADIQRRAWANKTAQGFNTTDVPLEIALLHGEVSEALDAYRKNPDGLAGELADVVIYAAGLAQMTGIDLAAAVSNKLTVNEARVYARDDRGTLRKVGGSR